MRPALVLAVVLLALSACAGPTAGLPALVSGLTEVAAGCPAASPAGANAAALGLAALRLAPAGQDLAALAGRLVQGDQVAPVQLVRSEQAGEVAGSPRCAPIAWGRVAVAADASRVRLVPLSAAARAAMESGQVELGRGHGPEARVAFARAAAAEGEVAPGPLLAVAQSYAAEDREDEALAAFQEVAARFGVNPVAQAGLGETFRQTGNRLEAAEAWTRAVALWPGHDPFVQRAAANALLEVHPPVPPPARRLPDGRWALVTRGPAGAPETEAAALAEATAYATCKEAFRTTPALRARVTGEPAPEWRWSPAEETTCTALWLQAYVSNRDRGRLEDAAVDDLLLVARQGFLDERSLFDVGARAHPLAVALLDPASRARLLAFVSKHRVLRRQRGDWLF